MKKVVYLRPNELATVEEVDTLEDMQKLVKGPIDVLCNIKTGEGLCSVFVNEEMLLQPKPRFNRIFYEAEYDYEPPFACGPCFILGYDPETGESPGLTEKQIHYFLAKHKLPDIPLIL